MTELEQVFGFMEAAGGSVGRKSRWLYRPQFRAAAEPLASTGRLRVATLRLDGAPAAGIICFKGPRGTLTWGTGYDEARKSFSPGIATFAMMVRSAIESGEPTLDLLRGQYPYKYCLGAKDVPLHTLTVRSSA